MHEEHPLAILAEQKIADKATCGIESAEADALRVLDTTTADINEDDDDTTTGIPSGLPVD
ncbi:hypothetical protein JG688_00004796, partial [Phytophthora aleatoria]